MNGLQGTDWDNRAGLKQASARDGDRNFNGVKEMGACEGTGDKCAETLHGLNNVLASMLLNAQVLEWKLPSYSRSRRYLHEIERNAQRGGELVKRLMEQIEASYPGALHCGQPKAEVQAPLLAEAGGAVTAQEREAGWPLAEIKPRAASGLDPVLPVQRKKVPHTIV